MSTLHPDLDRGPQLAARLLVAALAGFVLLTLLWMSLTQLDISIHASGQIVPSRRVQLIQSLEGGIVRNIAVHEGQQVKQGELLAYLENLQYDADLGKDRQNQWAMQAAILRLNAELAGQVPTFSRDLQEHAPEAVVEQQKLWSTRLRERDDALETAQRQTAQHQEELSEAKSRVASLQAQLGSARESLAIEEKLQSEGAGARADFLHAQQEVIRIQGDLEAARLALPRIQASIEEGRSKAAEVLSRYRAEASRDRSDLATKLGALSEELTAFQDRVTRREVRSPMNGVVNRLLINTLGGVAKAGETLMELVPVQDTLQVSVRVTPADIAFIRPGQTAKVRVTAYDSSIFGTLDARVVRVGSDAVMDERKEKSYFEVFLETDRNYLGKPDEHLTISPGMATDVSIHTGKRTLIDYLLKPVVKTFEKALRER